MTYWKDKVVVITGGSAGLGLELARACIANGANVALIARNELRLRAATKELGPSSQKFVADITEQKQVDECVANVLGHFGKVNALFNCAGKSDRGAILDTTPEQFLELYELNFLALVRCTRAFMPSLLETNGHVVNIGSLASKSVSRFIGAYPASKFPVAAYSQQLRLELDGRVHVLLACPGPVARADSGTRYDNTDVPESARQPGGGVRLKGLDPAKLSARILKSCQRGDLELVLPAKARLLFIISQISPRVGDWLVRKMTS